MLESVGQSSRLQEADIVKLLKADEPIFLWIGSDGPQNTGWDDQHLGSGSQRSVSYAGFILARVVRLKNENGRKFTRKK